WHRGDATCWTGFRAESFKGPFTRCPTTHARGSQTERLVSHGGEVVRNLPEPRGGGWLAVIGRARSAVGAGRSTVLPKADRRAGATGHPKEATGWRILCSVIARGRQTDSKCPNHPKRRLTEKRRAPTNLAGAPLRFLV